MAASGDRGRAHHRPLSKDVLRALLAESQTTVRQNASAKRAPSKISCSATASPRATPSQHRGDVSRKRPAADDAAPVSDHAADATSSPVAKKVKENPPAGERQKDRRLGFKKGKATNGDTSRASIAVTAAARSVPTTVAKENHSQNGESSRKRKKNRRKTSAGATPVRAAETSGGHASSTIASDCDGYVISAAKKTTSKDMRDGGASSVGDGLAVAIKATKHNQRDIGASLVDARNASASTKKLTKQNKRDIGALRERLDAGRFRYLNELLYTVPSRTAMELFRKDPDSFLVYHRGYKSQTAKWPTSPLDRAIAYVRQRPRSHVVADIGCGDATLAASVPNRVHSFDLVAVNDRVTVADAARLPLGDGCVDIVVFCLSLMGTNFVDFLLEANRVLKSSGRMKVLEVTSRFEGRLRPFVRLVERLGFGSVAADTSNSHFVDLEFRKVRAYSRASAAAAAEASGQPLEFRLQPCLYKKR